MCAFEIESHLQTRAAQPVVVGIVDVEHEIHGAARQPHARDVDLLQLDLRFLEVEGVPEGRAAGQGEERDDDSLSFCHHSMRSLMVFSYPKSVGEYQLAPRSASGRYSCGTYAWSESNAYLYPAP